MGVTEFAGLTAAEIEAYRRDGYVIPEFRLSEEWLARIRAALDRLLADNPNVRPEQLISAHIRTGNTENVAGQHMFLELARLPAILDKIESAIGPNIVLGLPGVLQTCNGRTRGAVASRRPLLADPPTGNRHRVDRHRRLHR